MRRLVLVVLTLLMAAAAMVPSVGSAQTMNKVRVMHASPDAPPVDVYVGGNKVLSNVPFFTTSGYLSLPDGVYQVAVTPAGESTDVSVLVGDLTVSGGTTVTLAAVNTLENIEVVLYEDELAPVAGQARVKVIHASPDAVAVDVKLAGTSTAVVSNAPFKASATLTVPAGSYAFDITPAGSSTVAFTTDSLKFEAGWTYTLVATGEIDEGGFWVQSVVDNYVDGSGRSALGLKGGSASWKTIK
jgi:Domain of unknown function (DUF4397)